MFITNLRDNGKTKSWLDRIFRFLLGFWLLGPFAPRFQLEWLNWIIIIIGIISLIESFVGKCLLHNWFNINNRNQ
ncbi:DUF2892 domain-containing protein [Candidatus Pacearchaeota archaeon]|nr:DUF2892 domain-containing protein [Candidatus Pacearchaeota archaeon]